MMYIDGYGGFLYGIVYIFPFMLLLCFGDIVYTEEHTIGYIHLISAEYYVVPRYATAEYASTVHIMQ